MSRHLKKPLSIILCAIIGVGLFIVPMSVQALDPLFPSTPQGNNAPNWTLEKCYETGNYSLFHVVRLIYYIMQWVWGLSGSLALLMFIWGGVLWLVSAGSDQRVTEGKTTLINAVIGIIIIFGSWIFINMIVGALVSGDATTKGKIFGNVNWNAYQDQGCLTIRPVTYGMSRCETDKKEVEKVCNKQNAAISSTGNKSCAQYKVKQCTDPKDANKKIDEWRCLCVELPAVTPPAPPPTPDDDPGILYRD